MGNRYDPDLLLEIASGNDMLLSFFFLIAIAIFIERARREAGLRWQGWFFGLPENLHFAMGVLAFNFGFFLTESFRWTWRHFGGADLSLGQVIWLICAQFFLDIGMLCKIRSITFPIYGMRPWAVALTIVMVWTGYRLFL